MTDRRFVGLAYLHYARRDRLTFDFVTDRLWSCWKSKALEVRRDDVLDFLADYESRDTAVKRWRESTRKKLAGNVLSALRDFGLLTGAQRKSLQRPVVVPEVALHLCRLLDAEGLRGRALLEARDWRLFQTELVGLEKLKNRTADQDARRLELEEKIEKLKAFDARLEHVISEGFASAALNTLAAKELLDKWTSRTERADTPASRDAYHAQERKYAPDLNDGVRINIAPLQRADLLAADVLAAKDIEKAIADRAEWRADERRWCREGKLPRPGWWRQEGTT